MKLKFNDYCALFDGDMQTQELQRGVANYRTRTVKAGSMLYVDVYPVWKTKSIDGMNAVTAAKKIKRSAEAMAKVNERNARVKAEQILNANFGIGDYWMTLTYPDDRQPADDKEATRMIQAYLRRVKRRREKAGLPEMKYFYTMEITESEKRGRRYHYHLVTQGDMDRDEMEKLWDKGIVNIRRVQRTEGGMSGIANYMTKQKQTQKKGARRWNCSTNLKRPQATTNEHRISRKRAEAIASDTEQFGKAIFEKVFKGYRVIDEVRVRYSPYVSGAYISVRMEVPDGVHDDGRRRTADFV